MKPKLHEMTIKIATSLVTPASPAYRPPSWPPPRDWPVVIDKNNIIVSRWGDPRWDISHWVGAPCALNFGDGKIAKNLGRAVLLDVENADLLRIIATWLIWGPRAPGSVTTVYSSFKEMRKIIALCSRNGISAARLMRFPQVLDQVPGIIAPSGYMRTMALLHRLYDAREALGFSIVDQYGLRRMAESAPVHDTVQTPYIPPRIWLYQVKRLHECVTDFLSHREQLGECFRFSLEAYVKTFGSLGAALATGKGTQKNPFQRKIKEYPIGTFPDTASRFGIAELLAKWTGHDQDELRIDVLSTYFSLVTYAGLAYIANFTLQRKEEVGSLRASCLMWEEDEKLGRVPIVCGETTKTDSDSDARWVTTPSVEVAIQAVAAIAKLRMLCDRANPLIHPTKADQEDPYLYSGAYEPWGASIGNASPYHIKRPIRSFSSAIKNYPALLDCEQMRIRSEDLKIARQLTPNLPEDEFAVGKVWQLDWHQYRRTGAVNMFASGEISDSTMQQLMKHSSRLMPLYYGRNHSRLHLNKEVEAIVVMAMYQAQATMIKRAVSDDGYLSPHTAGRREALAVNVISAKDVKDLIKMAKKGTIAFRQHRLGGCMNPGICEYGGIESVARCAGGDGSKPCTDVLYDRTKEPLVRADMRRIKQEIKMLPNGHPRYNALVEECLALENYLNAVST